MNTKLEIVLFLLSAAIIVSLFPTSVQASSNIVDFSVQAKIPENQIDKTKSYFDLKMNPGQIQVVEIDVFNNNRTKIETFSADVTFATTNDNGLIDYSPKSVKKADQSLKFPIVDLVNEPHKEIVIPPGKSRTVTFTFKMPKQKFNGVLLGSIHFKKKIDKIETKKSSETIQINNQYAYVIGVKLTETIKKVKPELHLIKIKPKLVNYHTAIIAKIQNSEPTIVQGMKIDAKIFKDGSNKILYSSNKTGLSMAPNSNFDYAIDLKNNQIQPGIYRLKMKAIIGDQMWVWDEVFKIGNEAKELNDKAVEVKQNYFWLYFSVGIFLTLVLSILFFFIAKKRKKERKE
ncbi:DUF916 and DUF3324 domain-containing protein [Gottfriedia solisilvae]|uniref:DUF916 and DUF3324 domain-containing protein n=1 Tax=Gottfriedia solisilvae TaxID=1516104 RepID=UPI003D2EE739